MIDKILAQAPNPLGGTIAAPVKSLQGINAQTALVRLLNVGLNALLIVAALYTLLNLILAGYKYISSAGDTKAVAEANQRITYTVVGLAIVAIVPLIGAILGIVIFGRWDAILNPQFTTLGP